MRRRYQIEYLPMMCKLLFFCKFGVSIYDDRVFLWFLIFFFGLNFFWVEWGRIWVRMNREVHED